MKTLLTILTCTLCTQAAYSSTQMDQVIDPLTARMKRVLDENFRVPHYEPANAFNGDDWQTVEE